MRSPRSAAGPAALACLLLVAGGYYGWIASVFGTPFVGNWDERVGFAWWQDPGLRDLAAYGRFGGALADPWFAGFDSVWDGVYATFFADGLASGEPSRLLGPPWRHGIARLVVWLGLLPAALVALGTARGLARVWRRPDATGLAVVGLGVAMATAFVWMTLRVPSYAQSKAIYWSPAFVPLFAALALGVDAVTRRSRWLAVASNAALGAWVALAFSVFWIDADAPATLRTLGERALASAQPEAAARAFERTGVDGGTVRELPVWAEVGLCRAARMAGRAEQAARHCEAALARAPDDPDALLHAASVARAAGDLGLALERLERLREVAPLDARAAPALAAAARRAGRLELARDAARDWLRFDPGNASAKALLATLPAAAGRQR